MSQERQIEFSVDVSERERLRLDLYLSLKLEGMSRSRLQKIIESGLVSLDGKPVKASYKLHGGEKLVVTIPEESPLALPAQEIDLEIVFEDRFLAVVNKPAGMITHPGSGVREGTLVNALLHHCQDSLSGISGVLRPGIVHRLDKDTSGLLVIAKEDRTHLGLSEQIRAKTAGRVYLALLEGAIREDSGTINKPVGRHPIHRQRMAVTESGRAAVSHFQVLRRWPAYSLVRVALETGRTHQIRVHMASLGLPVVGDIVYNHKHTGSLAARKRLGLTGQALHAAFLSFTHPITGSLLEFEAPLPGDFQTLVDGL